jgi:thiamine biosynthesis lipoprotein
MEPVEATDPIIEPVGRESIIKSADELREGWTIGISDPIQPGNRLAEVRLIDEALSTSGTGRQGFFHQGRRYGHLLDPRSGQPPDHFLSVTVIAASAAVADALSTAFFVMDLNAVRDYCHRHPDIRAIIVRRNSRADGMEIETLNFRPRDCNVLK